MNSNDYRYVVIFKDPKYTDMKGNFNGPDIFFKDFDNEGNPIYTKNIDEAYIWDDNMDSIMFVDDNIKNGVTDAHYWANFRLSRFKPFNEVKEDFNLQEDASQASAIVNGKIDSFPINSKEMEKQRLKEDINNPYFVIEDIGAVYLMAGPFKTKAEAERKKKEQIKEYNLEEEAEIIHVWDWNTIKEFEDNAYDTYQEFINAGDSAPYYKEEKLEESINNPLMQKDFERMNKMSDVDSIKDYLYEITMSQNYDEAKNTLIEYLKQAILDKNQNIIEATKYIINTSFGGLQGLEDFFTLNESKDNDLKVKSFVIENTGGNTMVVMGQLTNGNYFGLGDESLVIFDANYHKAYLDGLTAGETNWEEEHMIDSYNYDSNEYKEIKNQLSPDKETGPVYSCMDCGKEFENPFEEACPYCGSGDIARYDEFDESKNSFNLKESNNNMFEAREELLSFLNKNTDYFWDVNEIYNNCVICEELDDDIEIFIKGEEYELRYRGSTYDINSKEQLLDILNNLDSDEDFADFEYETESKDITNTLQEMALLEDYEEDNISSQKQKFIDYCKDKIQDLDDIAIYDKDYEENIPYHKIMHSEGISAFNDVYVILNYDEYDSNFIVVDSNDNIVINTPMIDANYYAATMQFDIIDTEYYHNLLNYWNDLNMDEMVEED